MGLKWFEGQQGARHEQGCAQSTSERMRAHCEGYTKRRTNMDIRSIERNEAHCSEAGYRHIQQDDAA